MRVDLVGADHRDLGVALAEATRLAREVEAARIEVVATAITAATPAADGHRDPAAWVRATLDVSRETSLLLVARARLAIHFPAYLEALRDGRLHLDHYDELLRAHRNPRARGTLGEFVDVFTSCARRLTFADFVRAVSQWIQLADEDGRPPEDRHSDRWFSLGRQRDGSCTLKGRFGSEATAVIDDVLGRFLDAENRIDRHAAAQAGTPGEYPRTTGQRAADAFMAMLAQSVATPPGETPVPLVRIIVSERSALEALGAIEPSGPEVFHERLCRTVNGHPVSRTQLIEAMAVGQIQVMIVDALGHPIAMGAPGSLFTGRLRDSALSQFPECAYAGCGITHRHLQADHVIPRSRGGPTSADNLAGVCGRHNSWRHDHGYHLWRDTDGRWHTLRPDGTDLLEDPTGR